MGRIGADYHHSFPGEVKTGKSGMEKVKRPPEDVVANLVQFYRQGRKKES